MDLMPVILFQNNDILVRAYLSDREDRVVISFDSFTDVVGLDRKGFGEDFFRARDIDCILVITRTNEWYQQSGMSAAIAAIQTAISAYGAVFTYGSSMGGYAAIRHAHSFGATAIAFAPQYSVDPKVMPEETRWPQAGLIRFHPLEQKPIIAPKACFVFYDPHDLLDRKHAHRIAADIDCTEIAIPFGGHVVISFLAEAQLLSKSLLDIIKGSFDPAQFISEAQRVKRTLPKYYEVLSRKLEFSHPNWAISCAQRAVSLQPQTGGYLNHLATLLREQGRYAEAEPWAREALAIEPENLNFRYCLSAVLLGLGETEESLALTLSLIENSPDRQDYHRLHAGIRRRRGDYREAFEARLHSFRLIPRHSPARRRALLFLMMDGLRLLPFLGPLSKRLSLPRRPSSR